MPTSTYLIFIVYVFGIFALETVNFDESEDFWKDIIKGKPQCLASLKNVLQDGKNIPRKDLILKIAIWAKANKVQNEFAQFVKEKRRLYNTEINHPISQSNDATENEVSILIYNMARINSDLNLSFKASCQQQNAFLRKSNKTLVDSLGFKLNKWCEDH